MAPHCELLGLVSATDGLIMEVALRGSMGSGSGGNPAWKQLKTELDGLIRDNEPAALLFDLMDFDYELGDGISVLASSVMIPGQLSARPACFVARGQAARAISPLLGADGMFGALGMRLFEWRGEAIRFLWTELHSRASVVLRLSDFQRRALTRMERVFETSGLHPEWSVTTYGLNDPPRHAQGDAYWTAHVSCSLCNHEICIHPDGFTATIDGDQFELEDFSFIRSESNRVRLFAEFLSECLAGHAADLAYEAVLDRFCESNAEEDAS